MKEINIIQRLGNKTNDIKYFKHLFPINYEIIVEPFGGSFAVSKYLYDNTKQFHINDLDNELFYIYKNFNKYVVIRDEIRQIHKNYNTKFKDGFNSFFEEIKKNNYDEHIYNYIIKTNIMRGYCIRFPKSLTYNKTEINLLNTAIITNNDYTKIFNQYKDNENAFIFLDPPYMFSDNSGYIPQTQDTDATKILINILEFIKNAKCKVMLVINKLEIIKYLFKDFHKIDYLITYQMSKKKSFHSVYCNY